MCKGNIQNFSAEPFLLLSLNQKFTEYQLKTYDDVTLAAYKKTREGAIEWYAAVHRGLAEVTESGTSFMVWHGDPMITDYELPFEEFSSFQKRLEPAVNLYTREQAWLASMLIDSDELVEAHVPMFIDIGMW